jgi:hypothetical protein
MRGLRQIRETRRTAKKSRFEFQVSSLKFKLRDVLGKVRISEDVRGRVS